VSRHFRPDPYQRADRKSPDSENYQGPPQPHPSATPPYTILWWRRTKPWEKTRQFWMSFKVAPSRDLVYDELCKVFAGVRVYANGPWFVVELGQDYSWEEVARVVALALKELVG